MLDIQLWVDNVCVSSAWQSICANSESNTANTWVYVGSEMSRKMPKIDLEFTFGKRCRHNKILDVHVWVRLLYTSTSQRFTHPVSLDVGHNISHTKLALLRPPTTILLLCVILQTQNRHPGVPTLHLYHPRRFNLLKQTKIVVVVGGGGGGWWWWWWVVVVM